MEYGNDDYPLLFSQKENGKRESSCECPTNPFMNLRIKIGGSENGIEGSVEGIQR